MNKHALAISLSLALVAGVPAAFGQTDAPAGTQAEPEEPREAERLMIGDEMPALAEDSELAWERGEPIGAWEEGRVYVVDFWATWCGPCIASMPHLIELQEKYEDRGVQVVAVHIWANPRSASVADFIASAPDRGLDFNYPIARETNDWAAKTYMDTTGNRSIPTVMVVDQEGRLAWHGHPNDLDPVLEAVVEGDWDLDAAAEEAKAAAERQRLQMKAMEILQSERGQALYSKLEAQAQSEQYEAMADTLDELIGLAPDALAIFRADQYRIVAIELADKERAREVGEAFLASPYAEDAEPLSLFAWQIVDPARDNMFVRAGVQDTEFAVKAAEKAADLSDRKNPDILDTLARAYAAHGQLEKALETQREALEVAGSLGLPEAFVSQLESTVDEYERAVEEAGSAG